MRGLMMDVPLLVSSMIDDAAECHGDREAVSRELDGEIYKLALRETFADDKPADTGAS